MQRLKIALLALWLVGCGAPPPPTPAPTPTPVPTPTPIPRVMTLDFEAFAPGGIPDAFVNVREELPTAKYPWIYRGQWSVADTSLGTLQSRVLKQGEIIPQPAACFLRLRQSPWGEDGELPLRYKVELKVQPVRSQASHYYPTGDQGMPLCYSDPTHYLEVVLKPDQLEGWECWEGVPESGEGWTRFWVMPLETKAADVRRVGAEVDMQRLTFKIFLDGQERFEQPLDSRWADRKRFLAIRSLGNEVHFDDIRIEKME